jgi:murein DD-endopeptidase MepM/ murein hydrolase activator NlpD
LRLNIILVSGDLAKTRSLSIEWWHALFAGGVLLLAMLVISAVFNYLVLHYTDHPVLRAVLLSGQREEAQRSQQFLQERLNQLAIKVGDLEAQLLQLDGLGERLAKIAGLKPQEVPAQRAPGRGGAPSTLPSRQFTLDEFQQELGSLTQQIDRRHDQLGMLEALLVQDSAKKQFLPTGIPVENVGHSSNFGWRIDPFSGEKSFHEGIDFIAETGTTIVAAASGKVIYAGEHPGYGKMVDIDHGNGLVSRYGHASKLLVKEGDLVMRGQKIAEIGSTGHSTGPHLHFEVRLNGVAQNPERFLQAAR